MVYALEGAHEPGEGGVWAAEREARKNIGRGPWCPRTGFSRLQSVFLTPTSPQGEAWGQEKTMLPKAEAVYSLGQYDSSSFIVWSAGGQESS